jgi:hypothetical protein
VTENWAGPEGTALLRALGRAEPPAPGVLEAAREVLWSAVAAEMLAGGPAGETGRAGTAGTDRSREDGRRRQAEPGS